MQPTEERAALSRREGVPPACAAKGCIPSAGGACGICRAGSSAERSSARKSFSFKRRVVAAWVCEASKAEAAEREASRALRARHALASRRAA
eukprot:scaffold197105_cov18-Tisochrysis_lutea.AAC.3